MGIFFRAIGSNYGTRRNAPETLREYQPPCGRGIRRNFYFKTIDGASLRLAILRRLWGDVAHHLDSKRGDLPSGVEKGDGAGGEGALDVDEALIAGAAETEGDVTLRLDERAVNQDIELAHDVEQDGVFFYLLPSITCETPHVVAQFGLDAMDERSGAVGLLQGVAAREGDGGFVIGDDLHQFVEGALFPTLRIPRGGIMAAWAMVIAARQVD